MSAKKTKTKKQRLSELLAKEMSIEDLRWRRDLAKIGPLWTKWKPTKPTKQKP